MIDFEGQSVVVTGAGRGLGRAYALELARRGAAVVVNDIGTSVTGGGADTSVADQVVKEIAAAGGTAVASADSVADRAGGAAVVQAAVDAFGRIDALVSNAGIYEMLPFEELSAEQWERMRQVHLDGAFHVAQPAYRRMKAQGYGRIVFVTSTIAAFGQELTTHYSAAKGGVIGLTHSLANEGRPHGVLVNAVLPIASTRMMTGSLEGGDPGATVRALFEATTPERATAAVAYLASAECQLSHQLISAVGGRFARVFVGLGEGWVAPPGTEPTAEDVAAHLEEITATSPSSVPGGVADELLAVLGRLGVV